MPPPYVSTLRVVVSPHTAGSGSAAARRRGEADQFVANFAQFLAGEGEGGSGPGRMDTELDPSEIGARLKARL